MSKTLRRHEQDIGVMAVAAPAEAAGAGADGELALSYVNLSIYAGKWSASIVDREDV